MSIPCILDIESLKPERLVSAKADIVESYNAKDLLVADDGIRLTSPDIMPLAITKSVQLIFDGGMILRFQGDYAQTMADRLGLEFRTRISGYEIGLSKPAPPIRRSEEPAGLGTKPELPPKPLIVARNAAPRSKKDNN